MSKYRKKPVVVEAMQFIDNHEICNSHEIAEWVKANEWPIQLENGRLWLKTLESADGRHLVSPSDWVIKGVKGEFYPCKPDIFAATYEPVQPSAPSTEDGAMRAARKIIGWVWEKEYSETAIANATSNIADIIRRHCPAPPQLTPDERHWLDNIDKSLENCSPKDDDLECLRDLKFLRGVLDRIAPFRKEKQP